MKKQSANIPEPIAFDITTEFIKLDSLLKAVNIVGSGGEAKLLIATGEVEVNGEEELRRGRKLYPDDIVAVDEYRFIIKSS
jgi:ribosome-associated protein